MAMPMRSSGVHSRAFCCRISSRSSSLQTKNPCPRSHQLVRASKNEAVQQMESYKAGLRGVLTQTASRAGVRVTAAAVEDAGATEKSLRELDSNDFYSYLEGAGDRLVVVDFYTDWCGPCKVMLPLLVELADELNGRADIVKFNCSAKNKELGKALKIKVAPTFHLYKNSNKVAEMTGAKIDELKALINENI